MCERGCKPPGGLGAQPLEIFWILTLVDSLKSLVQQHDLSYFSFFVLMEQFCNFVMFLFELLVREGTSSHMFRAASAM